MDSAQVRILEQMHQKRLGALLQRLDRLRLPPHAVAAQRLQRQGDFAHLRRVRGKGEAGKRLRGESGDQLTRRENGIFNSSRSVDF